MPKNSHQKTGTVAGIPYDWRKPTKARLKSRIWNPEAPLATKRWFGWGYDLNWYAVFHPLKWQRNRAKK